MSSLPHPPVPTTLAAIGIPIGSVVVVGDYQNERGGIEFTMSLDFAMAGG